MHFQGQKMLGRYTRIPITLARVQGGPQVQLREQAKQTQLGRTSFDIHVDEQGQVHPQPGPLFLIPNGMSLRPVISPFFQQTVDSFRGRRTTIFVLPEDTPLPSELVLWHEHSDHYSLQPAVTMDLNRFNSRLTAFLGAHGKAMGKDAFRAFASSSTHSDKV